MYKSLYAIIVNYNNYADTKHCIESLRKSNYPVTKIILVDNGSQDGSIERLQEDYLQDEKVNIIRNECNLGFAAAVNIGIKYALDWGAKLIFLINNDAIVDQTCIEKLCSVMIKSDRVGIVGPRIFYYKNPERIWQGGGYFSYIKTGVVSPEKNKLATRCSTKVKKVSFITGCTMLVKQEVFEKIGLFDEEFFFYGEDVDFCLRAMRAGFSLYYVPVAKAWHKIESITKDRTSPFVMYHLARSHLLIIRKNFSIIYYIYGVIVHLFFYTPYRMWQIINGSRSWDAVWAWLKGTWDCLFGKKGNNRVPKAK